jgi:hypothetical protein
VGLKYRWKAGVERAHAVRGKCRCDVIKIDSGCTTLSFQDLIPSTRRPKTVKYAPTELITYEDWVAFLRHLFIKVFSIFGVTYRNSKTQNGFL